MGRLLDRRGEEGRVGDLGDVDGDSGFSIQESIDSFGPHPPTRNVDWELGDRWASIGVDRGCQGTPGKTYPGSTSTIFLRKPLYQSL